jgi:hypothetical protein
LSLELGEEKLKITGFDDLTRQLEDAQKALESLDGEIGTVSFNPRDPGSIEAAIKQIESVIDERVGIYASNPIIAPLIEGMKEQYRKGIIERAAAERLKEGDE